MMTLAIESSSPRGSVAMLRGDQPLFEAEFSSDRAHNAVMFHPLKAALEAGEPARIIVGIGPGSYTGVRVGCAAAIGIGLAKNIPVIGWPSLCAFDAPERCQVIGDARRGSYFLATLENGRLVAPPEVFLETELPKHLEPPVFTFDTSSLPFPDIICAHPSATRLASAAARELSTRPDLARPPEPIYLRPPFTTTPRTAAGNDMTQSA